MDYFWLVCCWILYFLLHSVSASKKMKKSAEHVGINLQKYRLFFNIFALVSILPILLFAGTIDKVYVFSQSVFMKITGLFLAGWGIVVVKIAFKSYDTKAFLGLGNMSGENHFAKDGLLKYVRHPLYSGSMLVLLGYFFYSPTYSTAVNVSLMILYFIVGSRFEEKRLTRLFGDQYREYKKNTPAFIPDLFSNR